MTKLRDYLRWLDKTMRVEDEPTPEPALVRAEFPCGVPTCIADQTEVERDEKYVVVGCDEHDAQTRWEHTPRPVSPLQVIDFRAKWKSYGTGVR